MTYFNPLVEGLLKVPTEELNEILGQMSEAQLTELAYDWHVWARPNQMMPPGDWSTWLVLAGRGFGKTRTGAETIRSWVCGPTPLSAGTYHRVAMIAETAADARDVLVEGESGMLGIHPRDFRPLYEVSKRRLTWPNGAIATLYNATEPDQLRGPQHDCFIAGTMVETDKGPRPIETIEVGDSVLTRAGFRPVTHTHSRLAKVGVLDLGSQKLVGTPEHLIYTPLSGWTEMSALKEGDMLWPIEYTTRGSLTPSGSILEEVAITSEGLESLEGVEASSTCIDAFGPNTSGQSLQDTTSTTGTGTPGTTTPLTSNVYLEELIPSDIFEKTKDIELSSNIGNLENPSPQVVGTAELAFSERSFLKPEPYVTPVGTESGKQDGEASDPACAVEPSSYPAKGASAPSVVSIWRPTGVQFVYCLSVDEHPEFFANGVLVHNCFWGDELAKWTYAQETWDQIQFGIRLGKNPRGIITTTPRPIPVLMEIVEDPATFITKGSTMDNRANLAAKFIERIHRKYEGTRLGRQELEAEILSDLPGALWLRSFFDPPPGSPFRGRVNAKDLPAMKRIVVAVDPSGTKGGEDSGDSIGIIVAGIDEYDHGHVIADRSCKEGPAIWGREVVDAYYEFKADRVIAETNFGGAMVESTIRVVDPKVSYKAVTASRGKIARAEPVSALYEQGRVSHVTGADIRDQDRIGLGALEDQLCLMSPRGFSGQGSPDRADALVWALSELMLADDKWYDLNTIRKAW